MREQQTGSIGDPGERPRPVSLVRRGIGALLAVMLLTGIFLLVPSIRGFSLSAEQEATAPSRFQQDADRLASGEVAGLAVETPAS